MKEQWPCRSVIVVLASIVLGGQPATAERATGEVAVLFSASGNHLEWTPIMDAERVLIAVAHPSGEVRTFTFGAREAPTVNLSAWGHGLPQDGSYIWEARLIRPLPPQVARAIRLAEKRRDHDTLDVLATRNEAIVQTGHFVVRDGAVVSAAVDGFRSSQVAEAEAPATAESQVVPDHLIVDGRACLGLGCAASETFGSETLRLKQSVVRLRFEDTSLAGLANRDWQLTVNEPGAGAERFVLEDLTSATRPLTVEGNAPSNALTVLGSSGNIGLGTPAPVHDLHVAADASPTVRLDQMGAPARAWDVVGGSSFFVRDQTNGATVPFRIAANAGASRLEIDSSGRVGIGVDPTTFPHFPKLLTIEGPAPQDALVKVRNTSPNGFSGLMFHDSVGDGGFFFGIDNDKDATRLNSVASYPFLLMVDSQERIRIQPDGMIGLGGIQNAVHPLHHANGAHLSTIGRWEDTSSRDAKQDIRALDAASALAALASLTPVRFEYRAEPGQEYLGFIAEDVPEIVSTADRKTLSAMDLVAVAIRAMQEQQREIHELRARVDSLEGSSEDRDQ